ncbi:hypothetical protein EDD85DRAFT_786455 [Armillaria nabsnona]|nr:hypothetical protein EDD85DRAFT_786455 [Armillaria nabsnona]
MDFDPDETRSVTRKRYQSLYTREVVENLEGFEYKSLRLQLYVELTLQWAVGSEAGKIGQIECRTYIFCGVDKRERGPKRADDLKVAWDVGKKGIRTSGEEDYSNNDKQHYDNKLEVEYKQEYELEKQWELQHYFDAFGENAESECVLNLRNELLAASNNGCKLHQCGNSFCDLALTSTSLSFDVTSISSSGSSPTSTSISASTTRSSTSTSFSDPATSVSTSSNAALYGTNAVWAIFAPV